MIEPVKATLYFDIISPYAYLHFKLHDNIAAPAKDTPSGALDIE